MEQSERMGVDVVLSPRMSSLRLLLPRAGGRLITEKFLSPHLDV
jgi:hypothetical protein